MALTCQHCLRTNIDEARYCYFDGVSLSGAAGPMAAARQTFVTPFVFPSGQKCANFDEFAATSVKQWDQSIELLQMGTLQAYFGGMGRMDIAQSAQEAAHFPDRDRGLDQFLARLPTSQALVPKLDVLPKLIDVGTLKVGEQRTLEIQMVNQGSRLVFGSISSSSLWVVPTESGEARLFQFRDKAKFAIHIRGQHLRAGAKALEGDLLVESNAGTFKLKVVAQVPIVPFPVGVLGGARTPREIAEKAKASAKQAGTLFADGSVAAWYQSNGWTYPVQGPASNGVAAVQQFYEALGLSKAPTVTIHPTSVHVGGKPGETLTHAIQVSTEDNRPVYAHAASYVPWLKVKAGIAKGKSTTLPLEVTIPNCPGETLATSLLVISNGQQRFNVPIELAIEGAATFALAPPSAPSGPPVFKSEKASSKSSPDLNLAERKTKTRSRESEAKNSKVLLYLAPLVLLGIVMLGLLTKYMMNKNSLKDGVAVKEESLEDPIKQKPVQAQFKVVIQEEPDEHADVGAGARFKIEDEPEERIGAARTPSKVDIKDGPSENTAGAGSLIGTTPLVSYVSRAGVPTSFGISGTAAAGAAKLKKLTNSPDGLTNSTVVSINGRKSLFGGSDGQWTRISQPLDNVPATPGSIQRTHSTWMSGSIAFHQVLEVVPGQATTQSGVTRRNLDTVLVRWILHNTDTKPRSIGMRMELDTLIGSNDGVPFTVPGKPGLVTTSADFPQPKDVPDFIQALELPNLNKPGVIAHLTLRPGNQIEPPSRVTLTHWSANSLAWDLPISNMGRDSSVVLYWPETQVMMNEKRTIGFAYGLGNISSSDKLGVTLGGQFEPGQNFTVTAYAENPTAGQTLRLEVPEGLRRTDGAEIQNVPVAAAGGRSTGIVTWKVLVERTGEFKLKVLSSTGLSQVKTISIARGATGGKLSLDLLGSFAPGQVFVVKGKVNEPVADQSLTLHLPAGLQKLSGDRSQTLPKPAAGSKDTMVEWKVRVLEPGKFPIRVSSSTGVAQTKIITIGQPTRTAGDFRIALNGDYAPGKVFTIETRVASPIPGQRLTLILPKGLQRQDGAETQVAAANVPLTWRVMVQEAGKFTVAVKSTSGVTQRKTVSIEPPSTQAGRFNFDFTGDIRPGKEMTVIAQVLEPVAGQTLMLQLPKGMQLAMGTLTSPVPASAVGAATVSWQVRVTESGRLPVRIVSSTGLSRTKTITLSETTSTLFGR